jgi:adhesin transport system outer membrane protein
VPESKQVISCYLFEKTHNSLFFNNFLKIHLLRMAVTIPRIQTLQFLLAWAWCLQLGAVQAQTWNLGQLIQLAIESHPSVRVLITNEKSALIGIETAEYQKYPTPQVSYESVKKYGGDTSYIGSDGIATVRITQPIFTGGQFTAQLDKAKANLQVSQASVRETQRQIALRVVQAYADWSTAEMKLLSSEKNLAVHQKLLQQAKNRIAQGVSPASDLTLVQGRLDATSGELFSAKLQSELAIQKLTELTGTVLNATQLKTHPSSPIQHTQLLDHLLSNALQLSPEVQKAKAQALISRANVLEKESALKPDVYLRAERQYGNYFSTDNNAHNRIFVGISSKFGPGFSSFTQIAAAKSQDDGSEHEIESQQRLIREQVMNDVSVIRSLQQRVLSTQGALQSSVTVLESFERQFNAGRKTWLDLMTVVKEVAQNEMQLAELRGSELQTSWHLYILTSENFTQTNPKP